MQSYIEHKRLKVFHLLVTVKLFAEMRSIYKRKEIGLEFDDERVSIEAVIERLLNMDETSGRGAKQVLLDSVTRPWNIELKNINPALVIMINDVDFKLHGGIDAKVIDGDAITFLPTIHGG